MSSLRRRMAGCEILILSGACTYVTCVSSPLFPCLFIAIVFYYLTFCISLQFVKGRSRSAMLLYVIVQE